MSSIREQLIESWGELIFADGYDDCIAGVVKQCGQQPFVVYDFEACVVCCMKSSDMTDEEAREFLDFNWDAWVGPQSPCFLNPISLELDVGDPDPSTEQTMDPLYWRKQYIEERGRHLATLKMLAWTNPRVAALVDAVAAMRDFVEGKRTDSEDIAALLNAALDTKDNTRGPYQEK
jgi:hypothetical protein